MPRKKPTRSEDKRGASAPAARTPWPLEVRLRIARAVVDEGLALASVARACGVSANTAILWVRRYRARGVDGLLPVTVPLPVPATGAEARSVLLAIRRIQRWVSPTGFDSCTPVRASAVAPAGSESRRREAGLRAAPGNRNSACGER